MIFGTLLILLISSCETQKKPTTNESLEIHLKWELISNKFTGKYPSHAQLTLTNNGAKTLQNEGWSLCFNNKPCTLIEEGITQQGIEIEHINGDFFKLHPTKEMKALEAGQSMVIDLKSNVQMVKITDVPQGFYFVFTNDKEETFYTPKVAYADFPQDQLKLSEDDKMPMSTPQSEFKFNAQVEKIDLSPEQLVLPRPNYIKSREGSFDLSKLVSISGQGLTNESIFFVKKLIEPKGLALKVIPSNSSLKMKIEGLEFSDAKEAYQLDITSTGISIQANDQAGIYYAVQSLLKLFPIDNKVGKLPLIIIKDEPRFEY